MSEELNTMPEECMICFEEIKDVPCEPCCKKYIHAECKERWVNEGRGRSCPHCRAPYADQYELVRMNFLEATASLRSEIGERRIEHLREQIQGLLRQEEVRSPQQVREIFLEMTANLRMYVGEIREPVRDISDAQAEIQSQIEYEESNEELATRRPDTPSLDLDQELFDLQSDTGNGNDTIFNWPV